MINLDCSNVFEAGEDNLTLRADPVVTVDKVEAQLGLVRTQELEVDRGDRAHLVRGHRKRSADDGRRAQEGLENRELRGRPVGEEAREYGRGHKSEEVGACGGEPGDRLLECPVETAAVRGLGDTSASGDVCTKSKGGARRDDVGDGRGDHQRLMNDFWPCFDDL
jgi:hypothetical protein